MNTKRKAFAAVLLIALLSGIGAIYVYPVLNPVHVDATRVEKGSLYLTVKAPGQVVPKELVPVLAPASAKVVSVAVSLGQEVKKGDVLMEIEVVSAGQGVAPSAPSTVPPTTQPPIAPAAPTAQSPRPGPSPSPTPGPQSTTPAPSPSAAPTAPQPSPLPTTEPTQPAAQPSPLPTTEPTQPPSQPSPQPTTEPTQPPSQPSPAPTQSAPAPGPTAPPAAPSPAPTSGHTVQPGDTLSDIAARNGTTVEEIARSNGISNPDLIYPGQQLNVPQGRPGQGGALAGPGLTRSRIVTAITSPIDGQVVKLEVRADQLVAPQTPLAVLADMTALFLEILVDREGLPEIAEGKAAQTVLDALSKETIRGKVLEIGAWPVTGPLGTSGYPVRIGLEAPPKGIRLGMTGQAEIVTRQLSNVVFISKRAVLERNGGAQVLVVEGDRVQMTDVTLGQKTREYYEVTSGLVVGQQVVVTNLDDLDDGSRVVVDRILGPK